MSPGAVVCEGVWKKFRRGERHDTLRDLIPALARRLTGRKRPALEKEEFWAVRDLGLSVRPGEVVGLIGPNGSGKSTILKLLAGILEPTRGSVRVAGRVGALIEIAAGFHSELTGRENIYLQGAVMGMSRAEIERKFGRIVEFAGIGEFLDTQVKRYSSGMSARLGFSIAAHLDPDVLLVDEVLAVGDREFQARAEGRIREIVAGEVAVVLVSHQLDRIRSLCDHALLMAGGRVAYAGPAAECVARYVRGEHLTDGAEAADAPIRITTIEGESAGAVPAGARARLVVRGDVGPDGPDGATLGLYVRSLPAEEVVFSTHAEACGIQLREPGPFAVQLDLHLALGPGRYRIQPMVWHLERQRELARGPSWTLEVRKAPASFGAVHLDPRMRRLAP